MTDIRGELEALQAGRCGICGGTSEPLQLDHDHDSGFVRGLLCVGCNIEERDHGTCEMPQWCATCWWRRQPAVSWLGWTETYQRPGLYLAAGRRYELAAPWKPTLASTEEARRPIGGDAAERRAARWDETD